MNSRLRNTLEFISIAAIVGGLVLVAYQIQQSTQIARAEIRSNYASSWIEIDTNRQDESLAAVLTKSLEEPASLTLSEMIQLDGYYSGVIDQMYSAYVNFENGLRTGDYEDLKLTFNSIASTYFGSRYSQAWWSEHRKSWSLNVNPSMALRDIDKAIMLVDPDKMTQFYSSIKERVLED